MKVTGRPPRGSKVRCEFDVRREEAFGECLKRLLQGFLAAPGVPDLEPGLMDGSVQTADSHGRVSIHPWALGSSKPGKAGQAPSRGEGEKELMYDTGGLQREGRVELSG